jgi:hypothetical protein
MEKLMLMQAAAALASGVMTNAPDNLPVPGEGKVTDPAIQAANFQQWEIFRIFYHGLLGALNDEASFPAPPAGAAGRGLAAVLDHPAVKALLDRLQIALPKV